MLLRSPASFRARVRPTSGQSNTGTVLVVGETSKPKRREQFQPRFSFFFSFFLSFRFSSPLVPLLADEYELLLLKLEPGSSSHACTPCWRDNRMRGVKRPCSGEKREGRAHEYDGINVSNSET